MSSDHSDTGRTADSADILAECERLNPSRGRFIPDLPLKVSAAAVLAVPLLAGELVKIVFEIIDRPHGPPEWAGLRKKLRGAPALADMNRWLVRIERHIPPGLAGVEVRHALDAVQAATIAIGSLEWRTYEDMREPWGLDDDDPDPRNWAEIHCERVWRADAETARQQVGELSGSVERLTNALAACFLVNPLDATHPGRPFDTRPEGGQANAGDTPSRQQTEVNRPAFAISLLTMSPDLSIKAIAERVGVSRESLYKSPEFEPFREAARRMGRLNPRVSKRSATRPSGYRTAGGGIEATTDPLPASNPRPRPKAV